MSVNECAACVVEQHSMESSCHKELPKAIQKRNYWQAGGNSVYQVCLSYPDLQLDLKLCL